MLGQVRKLKTYTPEYKPLANKWEIYRATDGWAIGMFFVCTSDTANSDEINFALSQFLNTNNFKNLLLENFNFSSVWTPEYGLQLDMIFDVNIISFGGYSQAQKKGINGTLIKPMLVFKNINDAQFQSLLGFHEIYELGAKLFYVDLPIFKLGIRFKIDSFSSENILYDNNLVSILLIEDFATPFEFVQYLEIIELTDI